MEPTLELEDFFWQGLTSTQSKADMLETAMQEEGLQCTPKKCLAEENKEGHNTKQCMD